MSDIQTLPNHTGVQKVTYRPRFSAVCSVGKAPFWGNLCIAFWPGAVLLEFESFEAWLRAQANTETTLEGFCRLVFDALSAALGDIPLRVTVRAETTVHAAASATIARGNFYNEGQH